MSTRDIWFDCVGKAPSEGGWTELKVARAVALGPVPLLLLYSINRRSRPQRSSAVRVPLDAAFDVLGFGIVFPGSVTEGGNFVSVELNPLSANKIEEVEAEEAAQAEAAGV